MKVLNEGEFQKPSPTSVVQWKITGRKVLNSAWNPSTSNAATIPTPSPADDMTLEHPVYKINNFKVYMREIAVNFGFSDYHEMADDIVADLEVMLENMQWKQKVDVYIPDAEMIGRSGSRDSSYSGQHLVWTFEMTKIFNDIIYQQHE